MIELTTDQIDRTLPRIEGGLKQYVSLQETLQKTDVSKNREFQKKFNHYYRVRRNTKWQSQYYALMQDSKKTGISFQNALKAIYENTGRLEASFASKLVASIHPEKPVIDKFVLKNSGLKMPYASSKDRERKIIDVYNQLQDKFESFLLTKNGKYLVQKFMELFLKDKISHVKMIDLVLWQAR